MPPSKSARLLVATAAILSSLALSSASASAAGDSWFHDPVSAANRAAQVAVPRQPGHTIGERVRRTRATYRARNGSIAVPASWARGHTLTRGQAVVIGGRAFTYDNGGLSAATRRTVLRLTRSLDGVRSVSCQGHADFGGAPGGEKALSRQRARAVCGLIARNTDGISTRSYGFGIFRPVVIGGNQSDRIDNRRVVVKVMSSVVFAAPDAPRLSTVTPGTTSLTIGFERPGYDGDAPITGYQATVDGGATWRDVATTGSGPFSVALSGLTPATSYVIAVRAGNRMGYGPRSNRIAVSTERLVTVPDAPHLSTVTPAALSVTADFEAPTEDGGASITGYQASVDGGATWRDVVTSGSGPFSVQLDNLTQQTHYTIAVRAQNSVGSSVASNTIDTTTTFACGRVSAATGSRARGC